MFCQVAADPGSVQLWPPVAPLRCRCSWGLQIPANFEISGESPDQDSRFVRKSEIDRVKVCRCFPDSLVQRFRLKVKIITAHWHSTCDRSPYAIPLKMPIKMKFAQFSMLEAGAYVAKGLNRSYVCMVLGDEFPIMLV